MSVADEPVRIRVGTLVVSAEDIRSSAELILRDGLVLGIEPAAGLSPAERELIAAPGLVNAHAHLDLGSLRGAVAPGDSFLDWVARVVAARAAMGEDELAKGVRDSADALLHSGTTAVLDIDGTGRTLASLGDHGLRVAALLEILDGSPATSNERTEAALRALAEWERDARRVNDAPGASGASPRGDRWRGLSPHATHTVSDALLRAAGEALSRTSMPSAVHFAETPEESDWLIHGSGPFKAWLGASPGIPGTVRLERAGLLRNALLIHGNIPQQGEPERVATAGAAIVHCPGSHAFFGRPRFPIEDYLQAGATVLLGTDSWASNDTLDMRREMRLARETLGIGASEAWIMGTQGPARWIPSATVTGRLLPGEAADIAIFRTPVGPRPAPDAGAKGGRGRVLDLLTLEQPDIDRVIVAGQRAF